MRVFLIDYLGPCTLDHYFAVQSPSKKQLLSILLQISTIVTILEKGGYSHNDLHMGNIMIQSTNKKTFKCNGHDIPFYGNSIHLIDYGEVMHTKHKNKYEFRKLFLTDRKKYVFNEYYRLIIDILTNFNKYVEDCKKKKKKLPWEYKNYYYKGISKIVQNHPEFISSIKKKYSEEYANIDEAFAHPEMFKKNYSISQIQYRMVSEFQILHPKLFSNYFRWHSYHLCLLPKKNMLQILNMETLQDTDDYFIRLLHRAPSDVHV